MPNTKNRKTDKRSLPPVNDSSSMKLEQYKQLCGDSRHYDQKLWLIPGAAYTASALFYSIIFNYSGYNYLIRIVLQGLELLIFSGFLVQYVKDRSFQLEIQNAIDEIQETNPDMVKVAQYAGNLKGHPKDRWFIRALRKYSAANFVFYIMFTTVLTQIGILIVLIIELINNWKLIFG